MDKTETQTRAEKLREWREANPEKRAEQIRRSNERRRNDPEKWARKMELNRQWRKRNAEKLRDYDLARDKKKLRARTLVRNHIHRGHIERLPCEKCGNKNSHAHHDNYDKPLEVRWLCPKHHAEAHCE